MNAEDLLPDLEEIARGVGVRIRYEKGDFDGGYCILRTDRIIIVNKKLNEARKASVIAQALNEYGIENIFVKPVVRVFIEEEILRAQKASEKSTINLRRGTSNEHLINSEIERQNTDGTIKL